MNLRTIKVDIKRCYGELPKCMMDGKIRKLKIRMSDKSFWWSGDYIIYKGKTKDEAQMILDELRGMGLDDYTIIEREKS